jgi:thymidine phosphorylase
MPDDMSETASLLAEALKAVQEAEIPEDLRELAFSKAFDTLSGGVPAGALTANAGQGGETGTIPGPLADSALRRISAKLGIDEDATEASFDLDEGKIRLSLPARKFDKQKSRATKEIALLVAAGRQAAGVEERTEVGVIRDVVTKYGKLDPPNFASTIREMDEEFNILGSRMQRRVKVNRRGFEKAGQMIKDLMGS